MMWLLTDEEIENACQKAALPEVPLIAFYDLMAEAKGIAQAQLSKDVVDMAGRSSTLPGKGFIAIIYTENEWKELKAEAGLS